MTAPVDSLRTTQRQQPVGSEVAQKMPGAAKAKEQNSPQELHRSCQQFEEVFLRMLFKEAHLERSLAGEEDKANLYGDLIIETLAKSAASGGGIGIGDLLYRELSGSQAASPDSARNTLEK